jgi:uncharacterized protein
MINEKVAVKGTGNIGKGIFAKERISKEEVIADWSRGKIYCAKKSSDLPKNIADYSIQFSVHEWIDVSDGRFINHSCEPNCWFKGKFKLVAMRDIAKGEQLTFDYSMSEDSNWLMDCKCGSKSCRGIIGSFKSLPKSFRSKYKGYISKWLVDKYKL